MYIHDGKNLVVPAPYEVHRGEGLRVGALFGIVSAWAECGQPVPLSAVGVFEVDKPATEVWQLGDRIYWNDESRIFTKHVTPGGFVAVAVLDTSAGSPGKGRLRINGIAA